MGEGLTSSPSLTTMSNDEQAARKRKQQWNRVHRRALTRLRAENPDRYAALYAEEAAAAGLAHDRAPRRPGPSRLPNLSADKTQEEST